MLIVDLDYDEEDDGFMFTRTRSKRTKAAQMPAIPEPVVEEKVGAPKESAPKRSRKKSTEPSVPAPAESEETAPKRRRSARNSGDRNAIEPPPLIIPKKRSKEPTAQKKKRIDQSEERQDEALEDRMELIGVRSHTPVRQEPHTDVTKIKLPFADTPIIRRNQEMRRGGGDGSRRSSLGNRGRRASSLIDSGTSNGE